MAHTYTYVDDKKYVKLELTGLLSGLEMQQLLAEGIEVAQKASTNYEAIHLMADITRLDKVEDEARKGAAAGVKAMGFDKIAIVGKHGSIGAVAELIVNVTGAADKVKFFDDAASAELWFKEFK